jgi:mRNA interferase RelE/StbE
MVYEVRFTKEAKKDIAKLTPKLKQKLKAIIQDVISPNPYGGKKRNWLAIWLAFILCG